MALLVGEGKTVLVKSPVESPGSVVFTDAFCVDKPTAFKSIFVTKELFESLGEPEMVTVTLEAGDTTC